MRTVARFTSLLLAIGAIAIAYTAQAQTVVGSACGTFPAVFNQQQSLTLSQAALAGQLIVVSVAVNASAQITSVSDSSGSSYPIVNAVAMDGGTGSLVAYARSAISTLNAGSTVTVNFFSTGSTTAQSCVAVAAFTGVKAMPFPDDAYGTNAGSGSSLFVTSSTQTQHANELVFSVFASSATPGAITALAPTQGLTQTCSSDATLCLLPAWGLGNSMAGIYEGADATSANTVSWGALSITFQGTDRIFANGFD